MQENGIAISMTQSGSPYDNAVAERLNGILKSEYRMAETFPDYKTALAQLVKAVNIYNHFRPHMACNMMSPQQAHQQWQSQNVPKGFQRRSPETKKFRSKTRETVARERTTDNSKKIDNDNHIQ
ncbi:integrase core domain-containing protein [Sphingobacterium sp. 2149]|uniref:integrase core domain-containing protein n=1 Tax=Sphingobacterium sp. 2149 TaxID=2817763 RepID=UPI00286C1171|nr:integrase core domain-containing protein [Sphingobacterium sp. 2149]